mgnify:CR=1 FL=1
MAGLIGLVLWFCSVPAHAGTVVGLEYVPPGLADLAWIAEDELSGTGVAERDGVLVPPLRSVFGGVWKKNSIMGGFAMARISTITNTASVGTRSVRMGIRPALDYRRWLMSPTTKTPLAYVHMGIHGVIPYSKEVADDPSQEERQALRESSESDRHRIGAVGAQVGFGGEVRFESGFSLGFRTALVALRSQSTADQTQTVSSLIRPESALTFSIWF